MKIILISIVLFVFAQKSFCQNKAQDSIVVIADWKKGDVKRYLEGVWEIEN
ncbi:MAG: hypothetical protein GY810_32135 [Aureispira sp.]|nr:hypothetical protein [Aureispira sp.]